MAQPSLNLILSVSFFENWPLYKKNLEMGNTKAAITKNFANVQQESGLGLGRQRGGRGGPWVCEFVLGFLKLALVWSG